MTAPSKPGAAESSATTETGKLGRYQLLQKLASGGMASVYLARAAGPAGFEKVVALKRIHPHLADEKSFVDMFLDEARIASRIDHANVCSVFDFGEAEGTYYIAMEYLAGEPFSQIAKNMARSAEHLRDPRRAYFVARMIADASEGLHAAHELRSREGELLNVVHRDISPQNLFITYDGVVKVVDFGIASAADRLHHTQGAEVKGKFSYMAPEQARGAKGAALDRRADVFALGIVLWEMLALKRLFRRDTPAETLMALVNDPILTPSSQRPGLTTDFDAIVMKALARKAEERYPSARELGRDLGKAIGKAGEVMGAVDLSEWLETLVPDARERSRRQIENALHGDSQRAPSVPQAEVSGSDIVVLEQSNVQLRPPVQLSDSPPPVTVTEARTGRGDAVPAPATRSPLSTALYVGAALVVLLGVGGVALAVGLGVGSGGDDAAQTSPPAVAPVPMPSGSVVVAVPSVPVPSVPVPRVAVPVPSVPVPRVPPPGVVAQVPAPPTVPVGHAPSGPTTRVNPVLAAGPRPHTPAHAPQSPRPPAGGGESTLPPPHPVGEGTLVVSTPGGWANVYDRAGRLLGQTPLRTQLPAGEQTLSLRPFGQPPAISVSVSITAGGTARVNRPVEE